MPHDTLPVTKAVLSREFQHLKADVSKELDGWATEIKTSFNGVGDEIRAMRHEMRAVLGAQLEVLKANTALLQQIQQDLRRNEDRHATHDAAGVRYERRSRAFSKALKLDLVKIDAEA